MSMPSVHIKKQNKKSPGNKDAKVKLNSEEGKGPLLLGADGGVTQQRHLRDASGNMAKSSVLYGGGVTKQPNGVGNITYENESDSWDKIQQVNARREIFGRYPPVTSSGHVVGLGNQTDLRNNNKMVTREDRGLVGEAGRNITVAGDMVSEMVQPRKINTNTHKAAPNSVKVSVAATAGKKASGGGYKVDGEGAGEGIGRGREGGEMSVDDLKEALNETRNEIRVFQNNVWAALMTIFMTLTPSQIDDIKMSQADDIKNNLVLSKLIALADSMNLAKQLAQGMSYASKPANTNSATTGAAATSPMVTATTAAPVADVGRAAAAATPADAAVGHKRHTNTHTQSYTDTYTHTNTSSNNTPGTNSLNHDQDKAFEHQDELKRKKNIIIAGMYETKKINRNDRYADDLKSLEQIFKYLKCEHALKKIVWVNRLGEYKPEKRGNRLVKVVFENERVAKLVRDRAPRLYENNLLGNIIVREDESREARDRRWEARNRSRYAEAEQGSRGVRVGAQGNAYVPESPPRNIYRGAGTRPAPIRNDLTPQGEQGYLRDIPSEEEYLSAEENRTEDGYITWDDDSESESEGEIESASNYEGTDSSENSRNEGETMLAAIITAMGIEGTGLEQGLRQGSVEASIQRIREAVKDAAVSRSMESGNGRNSGKKKAE